MKHFRFENGLTVAQLKAILADWPDADKDGRPHEVWIGGGLEKSSRAKEVLPIDKRYDGFGDEGADLLLWHD